MTSGGDIPRMIAPPVRPVTEDWPRGWWPTEAQRHLLHAALDTDAHALDAWDRWRTLERIEAVDPGSRRLLPLVWRNLNHLNPKTPEIDALKRAYVVALADNTRLFRKGFAVTRALEEAGIPTIVLKGVANALLYYRDIAARPMGDFDLLVRLDDVPRAFELLAALGWTRKPVPASRLRYIHGVGLFNEGTGFDLHWSVLAEGSYPGGSNHFWDAARPVTLQGVATRALDPADQLLHLLTHGARWGSIHPLRWVADTVVLIRATPDLDWGRLIEMTAHYRVGIIVARLLRFAADQYGADVPPGVVDQLDRLPVAWYERADFYGRQQTWHTFASHAFNYVRIRERVSPRPGLFEFLRDWWGLKSTWQVPTTALAFTARHIRYGRSIADDDDRASGSA